MREYKGVKSGRYFALEDMTDFQYFMANLRDQKTIAVDTETTGLDWVRCETAGFVIGWGVADNYWLPVRMDNGGPNLPLDKIVPALASVLEDESVVKVFWNEKFDRHFLRKDGLEVRGIRHDGVVMLHMLDENISKRLKDISLSYISPQADKWEKELDEWRGKEARLRRTSHTQHIKEVLSRDRVSIERDFAKAHPMYKFSGASAADYEKRMKEWVKDRLAIQGHKLTRNKKSDILYSEVPTDIIAPYAAADVHYTLLMYKELLTKIVPHDQLRKLYCNEQALADLLFDVESNGVQVDVEYLRGLGPELTARQKELETEIFARVGYEFSLDSPQALVKALQQAGVRLSKLTAAGKKAQIEGRIDDIKFSVDNDTLEHLAARHPFASQIQERRSVQKLKATYVDNILELSDPQGMLHTTFNANVSTGRMSSRSPNFQNFPNRDGRIRKAFRVPYENASEWVFMFYDFSQIELRLTAHHSQDKTFLECYPFDGPSKDVHTITCADVVLRRPLDEVTAILADENHPDYKTVKWARNIAKRVNFGIIYGADPDAIQMQVSTPDQFVDTAECEQYIEGYFERFPGVAEWIKQVHWFLRRKGFVQNSFGRYRRFPDLRTMQKWQSERAGRQAVNFLIQGDAADLFKTAAVRVSNLLRAERAKTRIVNFVHDEIQFYFHRDELHLLQPVKDLMEDFPQYTLPIVSDMEWSTTTWDAKKEFRFAAA